MFSLVFKTSTFPRYWGRSISHCRKVQIGTLCWRCARTLEYWLQYCSTGCPYYMFCIVFVFVVCICICSHCSALVKSQDGKSRLEETRALLQEDSGQFPPYFPDSVFCISFQFAILYFLFQGRLRRQVDVPTGSRFNSSWMVFYFYLWHFHIFILYLWCFDICAFEIHICAMFPPAAGSTVAGWFSANLFGFTLLYFSFQGRQVDIPTKEEEAAGSFYKQSESQGASWMLQLYLYLYFTFLKWTFPPGSWQLAHETGVTRCQLDAAGPKTRKLWDFRRKILTDGPTPPFLSLLDLVFILTFSDENFNRWSRTALFVFFGSLWQYFTLHMTSLFAKCQENHTDSTLNLIRYSLYCLYYRSAEFWDHIFVIDVDLPVKQLIFELLRTIVTRSGPWASPRPIIDQIAPPYHPPILVTPC